VPLIAIIGPRDAGPGEREQMLARAAEVFAAHTGGGHTRIDVPGRGAGSDGEGPIRQEVAPVVPALQSGSLFSDVSGVLIVDAHQLIKAEADVIGELLALADTDTVAVVLVAEGALPAAVKKVISARGEIVTVKKLRERDASDWLGAEAKRRGLRIDQQAATVLLHRFGSDVASLGRALDQLQVDGDNITEEDVRGRFTNRPDEPMWYLSDAITAGKEGEALRRLADFLEHDHPLVLLAFLEGEVRRRALAQAAPDIETYAGWVGSTPGSYPVRKAWDARNRARPESLRRSLDALARADLTLKTEPEPVHRVTLERLTVALCRWLG
jgi:DNA polymerase III delta subunit